MIRVLILAAMPALRVGLRALLAEDDSVEVVGERPTLRGAELTGVDLLLVADAALLAEAPRALSGRALLLLTDESEAVATLRALPLRSWGVLLPEASPIELQAALLAVAAGHLVLPPALATELFAPLPPRDELVEPLTPREQEVLELLGQGLPNKLIARELQISEHTVKFHLSSLFSKLGASSRTDAVTRGARHGLLSL